MLDLLGAHAFAVTALVLVAVVASLRVGVRDPPHRRDFGIALAFFAVSLAAYLVSSLAQWRGMADLTRYLRTAAYAFFGFGSVRAATSMVTWATRSRRGRPTPKILRDVVDALLYFVALAVVLRATLKVDLGGLLATSAALSVVVGLALQETLGNLFAGLALQVEPPFEVGDWVTVGPHNGRVVHVAWGHTRIENTRREQITIPNSIVAKEYVLNHGRAGAGYSRDLFVEVDYDSPPNAVRAACLEVLTGCPQVRRDPAPIVRVSKWEASGVQYQVRFWLDRWEDLDPTANDLLSQLWYRMRREGFSIPFPTRTVYLHQADEAGPREAQDRERTALLTTVDFLRPLGTESLSRLGTLARNLLFGRDEVILRQGDPGETFYLLISGEVSVRLGASPSEIARLHRGDFFGEMSLLTGEPRSATIVATEDTRVMCVDRAAFGEILRAHPEVAQALSHALAERTENLRAREAGPTGASVAAESSRIFGRLRELFRLR